MLAFCSSFPYRHGWNWLQHWKLPVGSEWCLVLALVPWKINPQANLNHLFAYQFLLAAILKKHFGVSSHLPSPLPTSRGQQLTQALNEAWNILLVPEPCARYSHTLLSITDTVEAGSRLCACLCLSLPPLCTSNMPYNPQGAKGRPSSLNPTYIPVLSIPRCLAPGLQKCFDKGTTIGGIKWNSASGAHLLCPV